MNSPQVKCALDIRFIDGFCDKNARAAVDDTYVVFRSGVQF
jgi:hypothetical protein